MRHKLLYSATILGLCSLAAHANAEAIQFSFAGPTVSGTVVVSYGSATDSTYPQAYEVTGISGSFSDSTLGISNAAITGLVPINHASPEPTNLLAPNDFSRFPVAVGTAHGSLNFDNLYYPTGSPQTATDYHFFGGFVDIYGLLFTIDHGSDVVNFWSNGVLPGTNYDDYGVAVATSELSMDYVAGGVAPTPEPGTLCLLATGLAGVALRKGQTLLRRRS